MCGSVLVHSNQTLNPAADVITLTFIQELKFIAPIKVYKQPSHRLEDALQKVVIAATKDCKNCDEHRQTIPGGLTLRCGF